MSALDQVPGLAGYLAAQQQNQAQTMGQLRQVQDVMGIQQAMQKAEQEKAYRAGMRPDMTQDELVAHAARFGSPDKVMDVQQRALDRKEAAAARATQFAETVQLRQQALDQQREAFLQRTTDAQARQAFEQQYKQQSLVLQQQNAAVTAELRRMGIEVQRQGNEIRADAAKNKPITEFQGKNALYGSRAAMSDRVLNDLEEKISLVGLSTKESLQNTPVIGGALGAAANVALSADQQKVEQAQRNFVNAVLRQESGAVISQPEFENAKKQYFPQPGDGKEVIKQKKANRQMAISGFKRIAGPTAWADVEEQLKQSAIPDSTAAAGAAPPPPPGFTVNK